MIGIRVSGDFIPTLARRSIAVKAAAIAVVMAGVALGAQQAPPAKCPKPLKAEVGATTRCTMDFPERKRLGVSVKVTTLFRLNAASSCAKFQV